MRLHRVVPLLITASPAGLIWEMWAEACANVLKAASVAWRTLIHGTERWFCEPDGIAFVEAATITVVQDGGFFGHPQSEYGECRLSTLP